ncbi:NCAPH isoform 5, partial [Pongo abelii]
MGPPGPALPATMNNSSSETRGHPHSASSPSERVFPMPLPRKAPLNIPGTPVLEDFPQNDDEKERLQRRRSRVFDLQFSTDSPRLLASPSSRSIDVSATIPKFTNTQITEHYSTCIKLSTENIDPMFQKTAASFDECSTAGVFLSTLHCQDYRSELLFPSDVQTLSTGEPLELPELGCVEMTDLKAPLQQCAEDRQICPSLAGFQFTQWDSETHNEV